MAPDPRDERKRMQSFLAGMGFDYSDFRDRMLADICETMLRVRRSQHDEGQVRLMASAMREMWYAYHVFHGWEDVRKVSIFGSARTPEEHPDYLAAVEFSRRMAEQGWMSITGAGDGIMKAGHEGPSRERSFGLSIRLPFETSANEVIEGDPKLINFRYFFTRKLMFVDHAEAIVGFPGGFGTMDEVFESLVLIQTGKSPIVPVVFPNLLQCLHRFGPRTFLTCIPKSNAGSPCHDLRHSPGLNGQLHGSKQPILPSKFSYRIPGHPIHRVSQEWIDHSLQGVFRIVTKSVLREKLIPNIRVFCSQSNSGLFDEGRLCQHHKLFIFS